MTPLSLELSGVTKSYGAFVALDDVSLKCEGARAVGYLGPNGAGKTTTLKILTDLVHPTRGRALVNGVDVAARHREALVNVGAIVETPEPYGTFTVRDSLEMAGEFRGMSSESIRDRIAYFDTTLQLPPLSQRMASLSKGLRQRVVITGALLGDPPVILLDEPTSGLDPAERVKIRNLVLALKRDHLILMSTHLLGEVTETCDDVVFLNHGRILLTSSMMDIQSHADGQWVEVGFLEPVDPARLDGLAHKERAIVRLTDRRFRIVCDETQVARAELEDALRRIGPLTDFHPVGSPVEETYLRLMREAPPPN
jgi:ABC-2 type transport system ATP-binding protein